MSSLTAATLAFAGVLIVLIVYAWTTRDDVLMIEVAPRYDAVPDDMDQLGFCRPFPDPFVVEHRLDVVDDHLGQSWACTCGLFFWPTGAPELALAWNKHKGLVAPDEEMAA